MNEPKDFVACRDEALRLTRTCAHIQDEFALCFDCLLDDRYALLTRLRAVEGERDKAFEEVDRMLSGRPDEHEECRDAIHGARLHRDQQVEVAGNRIQALADELANTEYCLRQRTEDRDDLRTKLAQAEQRAEQAEATVRSLAEHGARNQEVRTLRRRISEIAQRNHALTQALQGLVSAEWMVTHDWGGDRESVLQKAKDVLLAPQPGPEEEP